MRQSISFLFIFAMVLVLAGHASALEQRDFLRLNPYSDEYLACEELADEVAPIGFEVEHEDWKAVFNSCLETMLDIQPAAGEDDVISEADIPSSEYLIDDVDSENTFIDDYTSYKEQLLNTDSSGVLSE